ncbi:NADase-type glycan-binding domain-containing protein [Streptomyces buecherae]|uniref:Zinc ribbon domain-containing protein n=1 Tax=Streptomyces buecherae TaxID=2763006 RepID=A0A7H8NG34_9ACTN|nr:zinc ribbon domain-containing protein [Streptomyces buecherae]QKW53459.1 zinc ribbon domain-containing protein [Streptomyces buecherae]
MTRACPACGAANEETDDFCGNCGGYLGWSAPPPAPGVGSAPGGAAPHGADGAPEDADGAASPRPHRRTPATDAGPDASAPTASARPAAPQGPAAPDRAAPATEAPEPEAPATRPPDAGPTAAPAATAGDTPAGSTPPRPDPPPSDAQRTARAARSTPAPEPIRPGPASAPPESEAPRPVKPAKAVAPRPTVRPVTTDDPTTGIPCPACRAPNPPHRRFCRRCAAPLASVAARAPLPWWRTLWPLRRRTRARSGRLVRLFVILTVVAALCVGGYLLLPVARHVFEDTRDKLKKPKAVTPTRTSASAEVAGHPAGNTTDELRNRYWGAPSPGATVTYTFAKPFRLVELIVTNGASASRQEYARQGRALRMDMEVVAKDGQITRKRLDLADKPGSQTFHVGVSNATSIRLTLASPAGLTPGRHLALAEVEFFRRP